MATLVGRDIILQLMSDVTSLRESSEAQAQVTEQLALLARGTHERTVRLAGTVSQLADFFRKSEMTFDDRLTEVETRVSALESK